MSLRAALSSALFVAACATPSGADPIADAESTLAFGEEVYLDHCVRCHGENGHGDGLEGRGLHPPPRDLVTGRFEYKSTPGDALPTDEDLDRTLVRGILNEGMPSFGGLSAAERGAVIQYIKSFRSG